MNYRHLTIMALNLLVILVLLSSSIIPPGDRIEGVRAFTRDIEFDFVGWTLEAIGTKLSQAALGTSGYLSRESRRQIVLDYLDLVMQIQQDESQSITIYADPDVSDPAAQSAPLRAELERLYARQARIGPVAESILQEQLAQTADEMDLSLGGQPIPPILYHSTPLPSALIVSPRDKIQQDADISLVPGLTIEQKTALEDKVDQAMNVSSLVVGIGGIGVYPTMVMQTSDLNWLAEVVAHEWVHNFLTLRPLGINYLSSPELRTINETTASIAGKEIGRALIERYYPELAPPPPPEEPPAPAPPAQPAEPPAFDFQKEMHMTRINVDRLLAEGKVKEAEDYMEARRVFFWDHGYRIRKLNQAYFAFYGAYADEPTGAAGEDPVGAAVRQLRAQSPSLAVFLKRIGWISSFEQLQQLVGK
jgi:hypothetical protein